MANNIKQIDEHVKERLKTISDILPSIAAGDFTKRLEIPDEEDEFTELIVGMNYLIEDLLETSTKRQLSEKRYRTLVDNANEAIIVAQDGILKFTNPKTSKLTGYTKKELSTRPFIDFIHPDDRGMVGEFYKKRIQGKKVPHTYTFRILNKNGETRWVSINAVLIDWEGRPATLNFFTDITERKRVQDALQNERDNLSRVFEAMEDGVSIVNKEYDIQYVNPVLVSEFGHYEGRKCYAYFHDRDDVCPWCKNADVFTGKTARWEWYSVKNQKTYDLIDTPLKNPDGSISKLEILRDITERKRAEDQIKYQAELVENVSDAIISTDNDFKIRSWNKAAEKVYGWKEKEVIGKNVSEVTQIEFTNDSPENMVTQFKKNGYWNGEVIQKHKDGTPLNIMVAVSAITDNSGNPAGAVAINRDMTHIKQAELAIKESEMKLRSIFNANPDFTYLTDINGNILDANPAMLKTLGLSMEELKNKNVIEFFTDSNPSRLIEIISKLQAGEMIRGLEVQANLPDGDSRVFEIHAIPMPDNGSEGVILNVARDITDRKRAEIAMVESEQKYRTLFESSPEAVVLIGLDGTILDCNVASENMSGIKKEKLIGSTFMELTVFDEVTIERLLEVFAKALNEETVRPIEIAVQVNGDKRWVEVKYKLLKKENEPYAFQVLVRDITTSKQAEDEMKRRLMKFKLEDGELYLVQETSPTTSVEAFKDLLNIGYHGFVISRAPERDLKRVVRDCEFEFLWLAEKEIDKTITPKLQDIEKRIDNSFRNLSSRNVILINGLDYIIFKNNFKNTLAFIQRLREMTYFTGNIIIISLDHSTLSDKELRLLEKEGSDLEPRVYKKKLPGELFEIIKLIYEDNIIGDKPSYTKIGHELGLSKPTVRKRVRMLSSAGYVSEESKGRNKIIELTEMGKNIFFE